LIINLQIIVYSLFIPQS